MNYPVSPSSQAKGIEPIDLSRQQQVVVKTEHYIRLGSEQFDREFEPIPIYFDLKGRTAGMYKVTGRGRNRQRQIRYNPWIFAKYYQDNISVTVPHEVAHYLVDVVYGLKHVRPHGTEWKNIMRAFGADNSVTANFNLDGIPTRQHQKFEYACRCKNHQLGLRRHKKILSGNASYICRSCGVGLKPGILINDDREIDRYE